MSNAIEKQYYGTEPEWNTIIISDEDRDIAIAKAFNWYNVMSDDSDRKKWLLEYLKGNAFSENDISQIQEIPDKNVTIKYGEIPDLYGFNTGAVARMITLNAPIAEKDQETLKVCVNYLLKRNSVKKEPGISGAVQEKRDIQKATINKVRGIIANLEAECDRLVSPPVSSPVPATGLQAGFTNEVLGENLKNMTAAMKNKKPKKEKVATGPTQLEVILESVKPSHCDQILEYYNPILKELQDPESKEAYSSLTAEQQKKLQAFVEKVIGFCKGKITEKENTIVVRKKRRKNPIDIVKKLTFKKEDPTFKITSILASKIVGAEKLVTFNTKYRTLTIFEANSSHGLSVKGTTIIDFDETKSKVKKLRKPDEFFAAIKDKGIRVVRSTFDAIKSTEKTPTGRINDEMILYGVY